jgi:hypothetical protein
MQNSMTEQSNEPTTLPNSWNYDSIEELVDLIHAQEKEGTELKPQECFEIGILLQETKQLIPSLYRSVDLCRKCMDDKDKQSCNEPLQCIKPDIVTCRLLEWALVHGFRSKEYQALINDEALRGIVHRSFETVEYPYLAAILPLNPLQAESLLFEEEEWNEFIEAESTREEAVEMLKFYISWALEGNYDELNALLMNRLRHWHGPRFNLERVVAELKVALNGHKLFMMILRRVYFAMIYLACDDQYRDLYAKIQTTQPLIPGGMEQCGWWLMRVAKRVTSVVHFKEKCM